MMPQTFRPSTLRPGWRPSRTLGQTAPPVTFTQEQINTANAYIMALGPDERGRLLLNCIMEPARDKAAEEFRAAQRRTMNLPQPTSSTPSGALPPVWKLGLWLLGITVVGTGIALWIDSKSN